MKRIFIAISVLSAVVMLMGCTQKVPTPEKIVDKRERVQRMITRVYPVDILPPLTQGDSLLRC